MALRVKVDDVCVEPISAEAPAGEDARYDPEYTRLLDEIEKLTSVTKSGGVLWPQVVESACVVLRTRSKDLQAACYLAVGLAETEHMEGVAAGTRVLADFVRHYWENGFPALKRLRGRINALDWWRERTLAFLEANANCPPLSYAVYEGLAADISTLDEVLGEALPDYPPLRDLKEAARHLPSEQPPAAAPPPAVEPPEAVPPAATTPQAVTPASPSEPSSTPSPTASASAPRPAAASSMATPDLPEDAVAARACFLAFALDYARMGHRLQPSDPLPWRALRLGIWEKVTALPPADGHVTRIPVPDLERKPLWESRVAAESDAPALVALALAVEELVPATAFWLDAQRIITTALERAGADFALAAAAVREETGALLARLPGLAERTFADGTPFADAATREWLGTLRGNGGGTSGGGRATPAGAALAEAEKLAAGGRFGSALDVLDGALGKLAAGQDRFAVRLAQVGYLCRSGEWVGASALAEVLLAEADARGLAEWQPEALLPLLFAARDAWEGVGGETGTRRALELRRRLFSLKPSALVPIEPML